jgi:hypothetical protein
VLSLGGVEPDGDPHHLHHLELLRIHVPIGHSRLPFAGGGLGGSGRVCLLVFLVAVVSARGRVAAALVAAGVEGGGAAAVGLGVAAMEAVPVRRWGTGTRALAAAVPVSVAILLPVTVTVPITVALPVPAVAVAVDVAVPLTVAGLLLVTAAVRHLADEERGAGLGFASLGICFAYNI